MTDDHLIHTLKFLERCQSNELNAAYAFRSMCRGEMACDAIDQAIEELEQGEGGGSSMHPLYDDLSEEAVKRKLRRF